MHQIARDIQSLSTHSWSDACVCTCSDQVAQYYQWFLDVEFMVFLGFGGLMTFLRRYSYSAIAFNFLISAFVIMCGLLPCGVKPWAQVLLSSMLRGADGKPLSFAE